MRQAGISLLLLFRFVCTARSAEQDRDTAFVVLPRFVKVDKLVLSDLRYDRDTFYLNTRRTNEGFDGKVLLEKKQADSAYFIFMTPSGKRIEEGVWDGEHFTFGGYKEYYKNGQVKSAGNFGYTGEKMGAWYYYNRRGDLVKAIKYLMIL